MAVSYCFCVELCSRYNTQLGLCFAVIFVEELVCEVVWSAEEEVRVECSKFA